VIFLQASALSCCADFAESREIAGRRLFGIIVTRSTRMHFINLRGVQPGWGHSIRMRVVVPLSKCQAD
jgi:hypothetical protein